ncbi:M15 family metallopeptidase [Arthrospiribacter ruber]|uniref:D-alanyl-D-alanine dipeptidase n=1 Tax=Arthrospiribacter ruber TaxID=2487934 RepID=A0A951MFI5_9BACT|nr:M15 family metallopeptidase [Arthrospiribacter ruber]MBW3469015.1 peptidase M15 [Arthrospiribacter ruber]
MTLKQISIIFILALLISCGGNNKEQEIEMPEDAIEIPTREDWVVDDTDFEISEVIGELEQRLIDAGLVDVEEVIPGIFVDLKYSTSDNFFGKDVYGDLTRCYVQPQVAEMLKKAHNKLQEEYPDLTFLVYDGVRPQSVQQILWDELDKPDSIKPLYVADPKVGGLHNYGVAVDLTLANAETGEALDMGTPFDFFGYPAYPDREKQMLREGKIKPEHVKNREILRKVMKHGGFTGIGSEWWHFNAYSRKEAAEKFGMVK